MTATKTLPSITLPCPRCGEASANIALNLWSLEDPDGENFSCTECDADLSLTDIRNLVGKWSRLLSWIETVPTV